MQFVSSVFNALLQHRRQLSENFSQMRFQSSHPCFRTYQLFSEELVIPSLMHYLAIFNSKFYLQLGKFYVQLRCSHLVRFLLVPHSLLLVLLNSLVSQIPTDSPVFPAIAKYDEHSNAIAETTLIFALYD